MNIAKIVRKFARATFNARIAKVDGEYQSTVRKNSAQIIVTNPDTVLAALRQRCGKPVSETANKTIFNFKKYGQVSLITSGESSVLTLVSAK